MEIRMEAYFKTFTGNVIRSDFANLHSGRGSVWCRKTNLSEFADYRDNDWCCGRGRKSDNGPDAAIHSEHGKRF